MVQSRAVSPALPALLPGPLGTDGGRGAGSGTEARQTREAGGTSQAAAAPAQPLSVWISEGGFLSTSSSAHPAELLSSSKLPGSLAHCSEGTATVVIGVNRGVHAGALGNQLRCRLPSRRLHVPYMENHALLRELCPVLLSQQHPTNLSNRSEINTRAHGVRKECWLRGNCFNESHRL